jgi:hypothetical protein
MTFIRIAVLLFIPLVVPANPTFAQATAESRVPERPWNIKCSEGRCFMQVAVQFERGRGVEQAGLAVSYDQRQDAVQYVSVYVPPDAIAKTGLRIAFVDSTPEGSDFKLVRASDLYSIPILECTKEYCVSRVHPKLENGDGTSLDLFQELQRRSLLWVLFTRPGADEPVRVMIPVYRFRDELKKVTVKRD